MCHSLRVNIDFCIYKFFPLIQNYKRHYMCNIHASAHRTRTVMWVTWKASLTVSVLFLLLHSSTDPAPCLHGSCWESRTTITAAVLRQHKVIGTSVKSELIFVDTWKKTRLKGTSGVQWMQKGRITTAHTVVHTQKTSTGLREGVRKTQQWCIHECRKAL